MILVSGTRGPGFNSRIALIFTMPPTLKNGKPRQLEWIIIAIGHSETNNIIMKSCLENSFYMGLSYRSTHRPSLELRPRQKREWQTSKELNNVSCSSFVKLDEEDIIHAQKNKKRAKEIIKNYNPFIVRKESEIRNKRKKTTKDCFLNVQSADLFKITKLAKAKTQGNEAIEEGADNFAISIVLPEKKEKIAFFETEVIKVELERNLMRESYGLKKNLQLEKQQNSIFNHFPSKLTLKSPPVKQSSTAISKNYAASRLNNFFFPSNRVKTENGQTKRSAVAQMLRPSSCKPRKKSSTDTRLFNFDGTLENHRLLIPERPKTADNGHIEKRPHREIQYLNYLNIAKRCIKMKEGKGRKMEKMDSMKIQGWDENGADGNGAFFDVSCSSIKGEFSVEL